MLQNQTRRLLRRNLKVSIHISYTSFPANLCWWELSSISKHTIFNQYLTQTAFSTWVLHSLPYNKMQSSSLWYEEMEISIRHFVYWQTCIFIFLSYRLNPLYFTTWCLKFVHIKCTAVSCNFCKKELKHLQTQIGLMDGIKLVFNDQCAFLPST